MKEGSTRWAVAVAAAIFVLGAAQPRATEKPAFDSAGYPSQYAGPGREEAEPERLDEIRIGYFGPSETDDAPGADLWLAASMAVERSNHEGGHRGIPFRLVPSWSGDPWGSGVGRLARMIYDDEVWAVVGSIDGAATHLAEQVVAKARVALVSPVSTDRSVNMANVAWTFSCMPSDELLADELAGALAPLFGRGAVVLVSATDHDSRAGSTSLRDALGLRGLSLSRHVEVDPGTDAPAAVAEGLRGSAPQAIVVWADPAFSAGLVRALRPVWPATPIFGGPAMSRRAFHDGAGEQGDGTIFPLPCAPGFSHGEFADAFRARYGRTPECAAAQTYDAVRLVVEAARRAGLNRARIRDELAATTDWSGAAGTIRWTTLGENPRPCGLARIERGAVVPLGARP